MPRRQGLHAGAGLTLAGAGAAILNAFLTETRQLSKIRRFSPTGDATGTVLPLIEVERSIRAEQLRLLFKSPISIMGSALAATVSLTMLWGSVPSSLLLAWSSAILLWLGIRGMMWLRFRREESDDVLVARWARPAIIMMSGSGVLWGAFGAGFYLPDDPELSAFVILIVASMVLGGTFAYAAYLPAFNAFVMTTIAPLAVSSCLHGTATSVIFGATTVVNLSLMLSMGRSMNRSIVGMIRLKFANADLVGNLRHAKDAAEVASRVKSEFLATMKIGRASCRERVYSGV